MNNRPSKVMPLMEDQVIPRQFHPQQRRLPTWSPGAYCHRQPDNIPLRRASSMVRSSSSTFFMSGQRSSDQLLSASRVALAGSLHRDHAAPTRLAQ